MPRPKTSRLARVSLLARLRSSLSLSLGRLVAVVLLGLGGAWLAFALAVSGIARQRAPEQALQFVSWDGVAIAAKADREVMSQKKVDPRALERAGKAALANQAPNARALRLLAMAAEMRGDVARGETLVVQAQRVSRRDMFTQIFLIEAAIRQNDVTKVLDHYDIALRTNRAAAPLLFPRLQVAISNADIRRAVLPYLKAEVPWTKEFVEAGVNSGTNLPALVSLIVDSGGLKDVPRERQQQANLLDVLFNQQKYSDMRRLYLSGPGADPARLTSAALAPEDRLQMISAAGWQLLNDADAGGSITLDRATKNPIMALYVNAGTTRAVARKLLYLPSGNYRFKMRIGSITRGEGGGLSWQLRCLDPAAVAPSWQLTDVARTAAVPLTIPQGCRVQLLEVLAAGGRSQTGMDVVVNSIALTRI